MIDARKFGFIHMPKAGGSSFNAVLKKIMGDNIRLASIFDMANFTDQLTPLPALTGHIPYYVYQAADPDRRLFTVLRSPVHRIISNYQYILSMPEHYAHFGVTRGHRTLAECFDHPVLKIEFSNFQTKMLGWTPNRQLTLPTHDAASLRTYFSEYADFNYTACDHSVFAHAVDRLQSDVAVAILEDHDTVRRLCHSLTGVSLPQMPRENVTGQTGYTITAEDMDAIRQHNQFDLQLYEVALELRRRDDAVHHHNSAVAPLV